MNDLYILGSIGLLSTLAAVIILWHAVQTAPIRDDWESSGDQRYRERMFGKVPDYVPDNIMELPRHVPVDFSRAKIYDQDNDDA